MPSPFNDPYFREQFAQGPATTEPDACERFCRTANCDPFPNIPAALLNSSDLFNYVAATGMVCPFGEKQLKPASYSLRIGNQIIYWDENDTLHEQFLDPGENFLVPANSIVFIKTKENFRLPSYIAMRFNLKINNVHRGV